ncbi:MAG: nucleotidyltransferase family protein [Pseudomonadota bacterium]
MHNNVHDILCELADPEARHSGSILADAPIDDLLQLAHAHGVTPIILRKLDELDNQIEPEAHEIIEAKRDQAFIEMMAKILDSHRTHIEIAMREASIPFSIVKGHTFRHALYKHPTDRPFSDIDILVPPDSLKGAQRVLEQLDFAQFKRGFLDKSEANREEKWGYKGDRLLLAELHTDLVHVPALRRRVQFGHEQMRIANDNGRRVNAGNFIVAIIHAAAGHKFHTLRLLVDVLQAYRALADADIAHINEAIDDLKCHPEVTASLELISELFPSPKLNESVQATLARLQLPKIAVSVSRWAVLHAPTDKTGRSKINRHAFRHYQNMVARRSKATD